MREITTHVVTGDEPKNQIKILVMDEPGAGGANHVYGLFFPDGTKTTINFQNGPIKENGVNGITQEILLAIVIDRLESFQAGPFSSLFNRFALNFAKASLDALQQRTKDRIARGVEGQTKQ